MTETGRKWKKWRALLAAAALCMACMAGCGTQAGAPGPGEPKAPEMRQTAEAAPRESGSPEAESAGGGSGAMPEPPEGCVYDYQVGLEPIPREMADLGGSCVGTMHAFPSRIMVGLMKQRMEEEPGFKAEAEQKIQEARERLHEETGKDFEVEVMWVSEDRFEWDFYCTIWRHWR